MGGEQAVDHMTGLHVTPLAMDILYLLNPTLARSEWGPPIMFSFTSTLAYPAAKDLRPCLCINRKLTSSRGFRLFFFSHFEWQQGRIAPPPFAHSAKLCPWIREFGEFATHFGLVLRNVRYIQLQQHYISPPD